MAEQDVNSAYVKGKFAAGFFSLSLLLLVASVVFAYERRADPGSVSVASVNHARAANTAPHADRGTIGKKTNQLDYLAKAAVDGAITGYHRGR